MSTAIEPTATSPRRSEARTQAIVDATIELIAEVGFDRMTMDTVAARAKASKATIYRRWPDKTALALDAVRRRGGMIHRILDHGTEPAGATRSAATSTSPRSRRFFPAR